ncbi:MAG: hypothetical protein WC657_01520 [Candidatus Paceibacterota bacterium]|jgi:hypothetical protein
MDVLENTKSEKKFFDQAHNTKETPLAWLILQIASIWLISDIGYYTFLPTLGFTGGFTANPFAITVYYLFWLAITVFTFWNIYREWETIESKRISTYIFLLVGSAVVVFYFTYILPNFPAISWDKVIKPPSELLLATPWYFLPKSIDILMQQLLVVAMVLSFSFQKYSLRAVSIWSAILFGGAHLFLIFGGKTALYVTVFTVSASLAGLFFPYLILRVKNGFIYSYFLHWSFYAVVIILAHLIFKA